MRKEEPQIEETKLIPLLELDSIEKGRKIYRKNDQKKFHWQLTRFKIKGIDNDKEVLICLDDSGKSCTIPFSELDQYLVMKFGYNSDSSFELKFLIIPKGQELTPRQKFLLHNHCRAIPQGMVREFKFFKGNDRLWVSGPKVALDWIEGCNRDQIFQDYSKYSSQSYHWNSDEDEIYIAYRNKSYTLGAWGLKHDDEYVIAF